MKYIIYFFPVSYIRGIEPRDLYDQLIREVLRSWRYREVTIILDGCFIRHTTLQMLRLSLAHGFRAMPLAREVVTARTMSRPRSASVCCATSPRC